MTKMTFSNIAPLEYMVLPSAISQNNDFSIVLENISAHIPMSLVGNPIMNKSASMTNTQYLAAIMDQYFSTPRGKQDINVIEDITYKMSTLFTEAFTYLSGTLAPQIEELKAKIDLRSTNLVEEAQGYQIDNGQYSTNAPKLYLLDIEQLYTQYNRIAENFATALCTRYRYNVTHLNDGNIAGLLHRITPTNTLGLSNETVNAILKDVEVTITSTEDGDIIIDTNEPNSVKVDGATPNVVKDDDQSTTSTDDDTSTTDDSSEENSNADVKVVAGDDANVNVTINDETVSTENEAEMQHLPTAEKELLSSIVRACVDASQFEMLRTRLFAGKGSVTYQNLTDTLFFVKRNIRDLVEESAAKYLSDVEMEMLKANFSSMLELQTGGVTYLDINAVPFTDKIIIGPNLLNKNLVNKATAEGIDIIPLIRDYLRVYHNTNKNDLYYSHMEHQLVMNGITYDKLMSETYNVDQRLVNAKEITRTAYSKMITEARVSAFKEVMAVYVRQLAESNPEDSLGVKIGDKNSFINLCDQKIQSACDRLAVDSNSNAEDMIYDLILRHWYSDTLISDLYYQFQATLRAKAMTEQLTEESLAMIKAEVIAKLGAEYLYKHFIRA